MPSFQNSAPGAKSIKFADPLNPFSPFLPQGDNEPIVDDKSHLREELDDRLRRDFQSAVSIKQKQQQQQQQLTYGSSPYVAPQQHKLSTAASKSKFSEKKLNDENINNYACKEEKVDLGGENDETSDDEDDDYYLDDDDELVAIRAKRMRELQKARMIALERKAKGHDGEVHTITQDEFLSECTSSDHVTVHFFHKEFERCKIMDYHLKIIANQHLGCKFVRIDAEKAPFFVVKLKVKTLPTLIVFRDGKSIDRLIGFEDLIEEETVRSRRNDVDDFPTSRLGYWLEKVGAIEYDGPDSDEDKR